MSGTPQYHIRANALEQCAKLREAYADEFVASAYLLENRGAHRAAEAMRAAARHQRVMALKVRARVASLRMSVWNSTARSQASPRP